MCAQNEQLVDAIEAGDVVKVTSLLNSGADVETVDEVSQSLCLSVPPSVFHSMQTLHFSLHADITNSSGPSQLVWSPPHCACTLAERGSGGQ